MPSHHWTIPCSLCQSPPWPSPGTNPSPMRQPNAKLSSYCIARDPNAHTAGFESACCAGGQKLEHSRARSPPMLNPKLTERPPGPATPQRTPPPPAPSSLRTAPTPLPVQRLHRGGRAGGSRGSSATGRSSAALPRSFAPLPAQAVASCNLQPAKASAQRNPALHLLPAQSAALTWNPHPIRARTRIYDPLEKRGVPQKHGLLKVGAQ